MGNLLHGDSLSLRRTLGGSLLEGKSEINKLHILLLFLHLLLLCWLGGERQDVAGDKRVSMRMGVGGGGGLGAALGCCVASKKKKTRKGKRDLCRILNVLNLLKV